MVETPPIPTSSAQLRGWRPDRRGGEEVLLQGRGEGHAGEGGAAPRL